MKNIRPDLRLDLTKNLNFTKKGEQNQCSKNGRGGGQLLAQNNLVLNENLNTHYKKINQNTSNFSPYNTHSFKINFQLFAQEKTKSKKFTITLISIILACVLVVAFLPIILINKNANAFTNNDTTSYVTVGELWNSTNKKFNADNTLTLFKYLSSDGTINGVSTSATATNIRGYTYNGKSADKAVVVTLGGLKWQVVYLTTDTSGNKVATLWLTGNEQDAFKERSSTEGAYYGYLNSGLYSDWASNWYDYGNNTGSKYPSNLYSTSYIRVVTLNNGGQYVTGSTGNYSSTLSSTISKSTTSAFAPFTITSNGLTDYIVQPKNIGYQTETEATENPLQNGTNNGSSYFLNNESINRGGSYGSFNYYNTTITYAKYSEWGSDYLWLPSLSEMGKSSTAGIWKVNVAERKNYDGSTVSDLGNVGSTSGPANASSWSRSTHYGSSRYAYSVYPSGASIDESYLNGSRAVRPALHLNLTAANISARPLISAFVNNTSYGTVSGARQYDENTIATITATHNQGYLFDYWVIDGNVINKNPYNFIITADTNVMAYFKPDYGLNITSDSTFTCKAEEINSSQIDYYITAPSGYYIYSVQVGTNPAQIMKYRKGLLDYAGNSFGINYLIDETGSGLMLSVYGISDITNVNLVFVNQPPTLNNPVGGGISGINVCATYGGIASVVGDNFDTLGDNDTITFISRVTTSGYAFDKWVDQDGNTISNDASAKLTKKQVYDNRITAIFVKTENLNTNEKTNDNSSGVL